MKLFFAICSLLFITNTTTAFKLTKKPKTTVLKCKELSAEECSLLNNLYIFKSSEPIYVEDVYVYQIEEDVIINFDTKKYLPNDFNPLKGLHDLNWDTIELIEPEEEVEIEFDTKRYLPQDFNPLKGMHDLNWDLIELIELEEEVEINFDTKQYLPANFNVLAGM